MQIDFFADGDRLELMGRRDAYTGNVNTYTCKFRFSKDWEGFTCFAAFKLESRFITVSIENESCTVPSEVLEGRRSICIGVYGTKDAGTAAYRRMATNWTPPFYIREGAYCQGSAPETPVPDLWEQYLAQVQAERAAAQNAKTAAEAARDEAGASANIAQNAQAEAELCADMAYQAKADTISISEQAGQDREDALNAAQAAQDAETGAEAAAQNAQASAGEADAYRAAANESAGEAWTSAQLAEEYKNASITASADAYIYSQDAQDAKTAVDTAKSQIDQQAENIQNELAQKADKQTESGGFVGGSGSYTSSGGAVGYDASSESGGAVGDGTSTNDGFSGGNSAKSNRGGGVGYWSETMDGGAIGSEAISGDGFAGGKKAVTAIIEEDSEIITKNLIDAIQLGTGTNSTPKTLQVYNYPLMNADGTIPAERIPQLAGKADKEAVYAKAESDMRYLPKGTAAGYPLTVSDHLEGAGVINYWIQGNAEQETRSGKNLFNIDEITPKTGMTKNGTQIIFDAETYAHVFKDLSLYKTLLPNTTYTISTVYTGQGVEPTAAGAIRMAKPTGETFTLLGSDATAYTNEYRTTTFTTPADIAEYIWIYLYASRTTSITIYDKIQIELGESATDYEPYGAVPSPEFPGAVQTVGDLVTEGEQAGKYHVPVKICGKNWLDEAYFKERSNLTADASSYYGAQVKLLPDTQYTFSRKDSAGYNAKVNNRNVYAKIVAGGTSYLFMHTTSQANNRQTFTFTTGADGLVIFSFYPCFSQAECDGFWDLLGWCQIELGAAQTAYEPYTADTADIYAARPLIGVKNLGGKCINPDYVDAKTGQAVYRNTEFVVDGSCYGAASVKYAYLFPQTASGTDEKTGTALALAKVNPGYASAVYQSIPGVLGTKDDGTYYKSNEVGIASNMFHTMNIANRSKELYGVYAGSVGNYAGYILFTVPFNEVDNIDVGEYTSSDPDEIQGKKLALWFQQKYDAGTPVRFYYPHAGAAQTEQLTIPAITAPQSSAMTILAETATPPAEISAEYYQDVNKKLLEKDKKIEELQALILENIGG